MPSPPTPIPKQTHLTYLTQTITLAKLSPPKPTNFRVGCVIVSYPSSTSTTSNPDSGSGTGQILSTGYTLELPGNTHAEQCALAKLTTSPSSPPSTSTDTNNSTIILYTSLEPCSLRLSGNEPCVSRIIHAQSTTPNHIKISKVIFGAKEPGTFVQDSKSCQILTEAGVEWEYLPEFEEEILSVAMEGHVKDTEQRKENPKNETRIWDITEEERKRQEALPRNPKKRAMDTSLEQQQQQKNG